MPKAAIWLIERHCFTILQETQLFSIVLKWGNSCGKIRSRVVGSLVSAVQSAGEIHRELTSPAPSGGGAGPLGTQC